MIVLSLILAAAVWGIGAVTVGYALHDRDWPMVALGVMLVFCGSFGMGFARAAERDHRCNGVLTESIKAGGVEIRAQDGSPLCVVKP